jgi:UDP-glucose 4-epimerase
MNQVMQGMPCTIFGDGAQTRAFTHIADVAPAIARSVHVPGAYGEILNIGADTPYSVLQLAELVQKAMGRPTGIRFVERREEVLHAHSDHSKARRILGYAPSVSLEAGLARMAEWALRAGPRPSRPFGAIELDKGLPPSWGQP